MPATAHRRRIGCSHWLLRLFPREFRGDFGEQMADDFRDQREAPRSEWAPVRALGLWARTIAGIRAPGAAAARRVLRRDAQYAVRLLWRSPGFTTVALLFTLAIGIGTEHVRSSASRTGCCSARSRSATGSARADSGIRQDDPQAYSRVLRVDSEELSRHHSGIQAVAAQVEQESLTWTGPEGLESIRLTAWTPNLLDMLGVGAHLGRALLQGDASADPRPAMLTYNAWRQRFGEDPGVVGRTIRFDQRAVQIVGVLPRRFIYPAQGTMGGGEL